MDQRALTLPIVMTALKKSLERPHFPRQFMLMSFVVLMTGMAIIGYWVGRQIEKNSVNRAGAIAAVYVESVVAPLLGRYTGGNSIDDETHAALDRVFIDSPLHRTVVRFKLWSGDATIVYVSDHGSGDHGQMGSRFRVDGLLAAAFAGAVQARMSVLDDVDNARERERWDELLEVYVPMHAPGTGKVVAVAEFYHSAEHLRRDIRTAQQHSWALVAVATALMYLLLNGMVRRAHTTIVDQQRELRRQLRQLQTTLGENERMRERLREAGARTTALNEQFLHRVAADLHDGPAQELALALMRLETLGHGRGGAGAHKDPALHDFETIHRALNASLGELRTIASGLGMPGIADLSLADTVTRAVRDFADKSGMTVQVDVDPALCDAPLAVRITAYRVIMESLTNGWRHARGAAQQVRARHAHGEALIEIIDQGPGFVPQSAFDSGRLGLAFMRERVSLLGGVFEIVSAPASGTRVVARLPLPREGKAHA